jgi:hypothetical protein
MVRRIPDATPIHSPVKSIRKKCLECSAGSPNEVKNCPVRDCALWAYRFGSNPRIASRSRKPPTSKGE